MSVLRHDRRIAEVDYELILVALADIQAVLQLHRVNTGCASSHAGELLKQAQVY